MSFEVKLAMNQCIKSVGSWINSRPKLQEWLWFIGLWLGGMISFLLMAYPIKLLIKSMG